jgi:kumamolisin
VVQDARFVPLPGSERNPLPAATPVGPIDPLRQLEITLIIRRRAGLPDGLVSGESVISADELSARYGSDPGDLAMIGEVLARFGLAVTDTDAGGRRVVVTGTVGALERATGSG